MNITDYFEVVSTEDRVLHFRLKGFWSEGVMEQMETQFIALFKNTVDSMGRQGFLVLADTTAFKVPSAGAKAAMGQTMMYAREHNLIKTVEVIPNAIVKLGIQDAAKTTGEDNFRIMVNSVEEGWEKINELKKSL
jgi:hypothetical protein